MKIQFFYTSGHTFTATNVLNYGSNASDDHGTEIVYTTERLRGDVWVTEVSHVPTHDLMYAIITPAHDDTTDAGEVMQSVIIHGRATKFDVSVQKKQMDEIIAEAHDEAISDEKYNAWKKHENAKYRARRKKLFS